MTPRSWVRKLFARTPRAARPAPARRRPRPAGLALEELEPRDLPSGTTWYVNAAATGANTGLSWANAFTDLQAALTAAQSGDQVWVAQGTYKPTAGTDRTVSFVLDAGVAVYGGFAGGETQLSQRDWAGHVTTLSGDIGKPGDSSDNSYNVVFSSGLDKTAVLDGFTITAGNANGASSQDVGGGLYNSHSSPTLANLTFSGNSARLHGGGLYNSLSSSPTLTNTILWGDTGGEIFNDPGGSAAVSYSDVQGGYSGTGNLALDPLFVDAAHGDLHLQRGSPAIDKGTNSGAPLFDRDNNPRPVDGGSGQAVTDMGAYEFRPVLYVNAAAAAGGNGTSWAKAYTDLQQALAAARPTEAIWVAAGTYKPTAGTDRTISFVLDAGVAVYGGFAGTEAQLAQRDPAKNVTTLSGDIGKAGDSSDNSYHVVTSSGLDKTAVLDGFTIAAGNANGSPNPRNLGGGMLNIGGSPTLANLTFSGNSAADGGGLFNDFSSPALTNVTFSGNSAAAAGGGLYNFSSSPALTNVTFSGNSANLSGGGMFNSNSSVTLTNVTLSGNSASIGGGGLYNDSNSSARLTNVTLSGNSASVFGGGIFNDSSSPALTNVTFSGNSANDGGGGLYNLGRSSPALTNTILWGDTGGEIVNASGGRATVSYSDVQGGYSGTGNIDLDPLLGPLQGNGGPTQTRALGLHSPAIDAGNSGAIPAGLTTDQRGFARISGAAVDMGAFENQAPTLSPATLPGGRYGALYNRQTITATPTGGAAGPCTFAVTAGALPPGLALASDGALSGTPTAAGSFSFTVTATDSDSDTGSQGYTLTVDQATLTVTAADAARGYGAANPAFTASYSGFVNGEGPSVLSGSPSLTTAATPASAPGNYAITAGPGTLAAANYAFTVVNGTLTVQGLPAVQPVQIIPKTATGGAFDPATQTWYLRGSNSAGPPAAGQFQYGTATSIPLSGNWGGTGPDHIGVFDPTTFTWYLRNEASAGPPDAGQFQYGGPGWLPVTGDWQGSGQTGVGAFDPSTATWYLRNEPGAGAPDAGQFQYGVAGGVPVVGDWTGTGHLGIGVFDPATATWYLRSSASAGAPDAGVFQYGGVGWRPVAGDWAGAGHAGIGAFDPSTATFYLRTEPAAGAPDAGEFAFGGQGFLPVVGFFPLAAQQHLLAAEGAGPGGATPLSADQLQSAVAGALARLTAAGADPGLVQFLAAAQFAVGTLPDGVLGETEAAGRLAVLSADGAGRGWFVDGTPLADEEFAPGAPGAPLVALPGSAAAGKEDLLSAVLHEMGHLAGLPNTDSGLMAAALGLGTRDLGALDQVFAGPAAGGLAL